MNFSAFRFLFVAVLFLAACSNKPPISAKDMKHQLDTSVYDFNQALNSSQLDVAKTFVAPGAEPAFEALVQGEREGKYNTFETNDPPDIDYIGGKARVVMNISLGKQGRVAGIKEINRPTHLWKYVDGGWQWAGPVK